MSDRSTKRVFLEITIDGQKEGRIICELFDKLAPRTAENFRALCTGEYGKVGDVKLTYKGAIFHRVVKNFMIQGGDITAGDGTGGMSIYGRTFDDEEFMESHSEPYLLSMANRGPNTNSSQFFITTAIARHLDTKHVVFGRVVKGKELVDKIEQIRVNDASKPYQDVMITNCGELFKKSRAEEAQVIDENKDEFLEEEQASAVPDVSTVKAEDLPPEPKTRNWLLRRSRSRSRSKSRDDKEESSSRKRRDSREERHSRKRDRDDHFDRNREDRLSKRSRKTSRSPDRRRSPERSIKDRITRTQNGGSGGTRVKGRGTPRFQRDRTPPHWKREEQKKTSLDDYYSGVKKQEEEKRMADAKEKKDQEDQKLKRREEMERELELMSKKQEKTDDGSDEYDDDDDEDRVDLEGSDSD